MDINLVKSLLLGHTEEFVHMGKGAVHTAVGGKAHEVEFLAALLYIIENSLDLGVLEELMVPAGHIDLDKILINDPSCAEVRMTHLRVTHLAVRKTDVFAAGLEMAHWILCSQGIDVRSSLRPDGVGVVMTPLSPAIENHK